jgi:hypothetical protein
MSGSQLCPSPTPGFFVNVASKGLSLGVSLLVATLAGNRVNVADKGLREEEVSR